MASAGPADTYDPHDHPLPDSLADIAQYEPLSFPYGPKADDAFPVWKLRTESLLMAAGRWDVVTGEDVCPALDDAMSPEDKKRALRRLQRWQQRDAQARFLILQKLEDNYVPVIGQCGSAKELWERICEDHTAGSVGLRVYRIMDRILNRKYRTGTSFVDYCGRCRGRTRRCEPACLPCSSLSAKTMARRTWTRLWIRWCKWTLGVSFDRKAGSRSQAEDEAGEVAIARRFRAKG
ncbi:hypothetical protein BV20DRAFT_483734 [Pilatotrama ljubarskyi]|nr:hypothetical protein BV20DRAFT_483734 [Pilatotrama ljubarskyi]